MMIAAIARKTHNKSLATRSGILGEGMGRASQALKIVLEAYGISQNKLAVALDIDRSAVFKWFHEQREPTSETIVEITKALKHD